MKAVHFVFLLSLPLALAAAEVKTGDSLNDVRATLGAPRGQLKIGDRQILHYDRGEIELQSGSVTRVALLSVGDYTALEAKRAADAVRINEENVRLDAQGEELKARKLADSAFAASPLTYQLAFWQDFSRRYPGVPVTEQLTVAHMRVAEQFNAQHAQEERLAELEARVTDAEARADAADAKAYRFASYVGSGDYGYSSGYGYYGGDRYRRSQSVLPVSYRYYTSPQPYATSPGTPRTPPTYRNPPPTVTRVDNSRCDTRVSGSHGRM